MGCMETVKTLRVEPFIFFFMFATALEAITITQLAQDKICLYKYNLTRDYCSKLSEQISTESVFDLKNQILSDVTTFNLYKTLITTIPLIFWSLFLGAWADRHERAPKFLMSLAGIASCVESTLLILNSVYFELDILLMLMSFIPLSLCGGLLGVLMSVYSYISATVRPEFRTIKFAILEALIFVATPIGLFVGGDIIGANILGSSGQLHKYTSVFVIGLIAQIIATFWVILVPFEKSIYKNKSFIEPIGDFQKVDNFKTLEDNQCDSQIESSENVIESGDERQPLLIEQRSDKTNNQIENVDTILQLSLPRDVTSSQTNTPKDINENSILDPNEVHWYVMFKDLIDLNNVHDMWQTCTKERTGGKRGEIWILLISLTIITFTSNGLQGILFQFVQKVFEWNAEVYSIVNASTLLLTSISVVVIVPTLIKLLKFSNMSLSIVGITSVYLQNLIRGTFLNAGAFYVSYLFGSLAYVPAISVRSKLSTIVEQTEENKVFGLLAALETLTPFIGSIVYSPLFSSTIATYPGLVFHFSTGILLIPFIGFVYISNYCE